MTRRSAIAGAVLLMTASAVHAHKVMIAHKVTGAELRVDVFFEDDSPADAAKVQLRQGEAVVAEGRADETGVWKTALPAPGEYEIWAEHTGHVAKEPLTVTGPSVAMPAEASPGREAVVGVQWLKIAAGIGVIVVVFAVLMVTGRQKRA